MTSNNQTPVLVRKARTGAWLCSRWFYRARTRTRNVALKRWRHYSSRAARGLKITCELARNGLLRIINIIRVGFRRMRKLHKPFVRFARRCQRAAELLRAQRQERYVDRQTRQAARSARPLVLGPWTSEVGFEVLYWIPFLHWLQAESAWDPASAVAISRGGVASWYTGLAETYVEVFDYVEPERFAARNEARTISHGSRKQLKESDFDRDLIRYGCSIAGITTPSVVHPSQMYKLFRQFWLGHRPLTHVAERTRFTTRMPPKRFDLTELPADYVAVKLYAAQSLPDSPRNCNVVHRFVDRLTNVTNVVTLETSFAADDHKDYRLDPRDHLFDVHALMLPTNNLELQTQVIAGARALISTCGSLAWLAPMLGVPTVALFSDDSFLRAHLYFARHAYNSMGAARFNTIDVGAFEDVGIDTVFDLARTAFR